MFDEDSYNPAAQDSALTPAQQQTLREAKSLLENGKAGQAAPLFARLAEILASAGQPRRAANMHAQAAQTFAQNRNETGTLTQARAALTLFVQYKMEQRAQFFYTAIRRELTKRGMPATAETLAKEFSTRVTTQPVPTAPPAQPIDRLPANCPNCGAPVRTEAARWIDKNSLECAYCGTPIRPVA